MGSTSVWDFKMSKLRGKRWTLVLKFRYSTLGGVSCPKRQMYISASFSHARPPWVQNSSHCVIFWTIRLRGYPKLWACYSQYPIYWESIENQRYLIRMSNLLMNSASISSQRSPSTIQFNFQIAFDSVLLFAERQFFSRNGNPFKIRHNERFGWYEDAHLLFYNRTSDVLMPL